MVQQLLHEFSSSCYCVSMRARVGLSKVEGGESFYDVRGRFLPFIDDLIEQYRDTGASLVCVGDGGLYWMMLPLVMIP